MNDNITLPRAVSAAISQILIDSQSVSDYQLEREEWAEKQIVDALAQDNFEQEVADSALLGNIESPFNACMHQEHCKQWKAQASAGTPATADLTDEQIIDLFHRKTTGLGRKGIIAFARAMLAAAPQPPTTEQSSAVQQPQGEQEPVAWCVMNGVSRYQLLKTKVVADALAAEMQKRHDLSGSIAAFHVKPAYTYLQPKREPLTDEQILGFGPGQEDAEWTYEDQLYFARAIERAHGIGGKQ